MQPPRFCARLRLGRRQFLGTLGALSAQAAGWPRARAEEPPPVTQPRQTSGDTASQPVWEERLTLTVGPSDADLVGTTEKVIQAAVDSVARRGGGTVHLLPGKYRMRNAVYLASGVRLLGSGDETILWKEPSVSTTLAADSDWFDQEITLSDASGFRVGDGIRLRTTNPHHGGAQIVKRTLVARSGNRFKLDRPLRENFWQLGETTCATLFPLVAGEDGLTHLAIERLALDGNRAQNENLDGNYAGCIFLQDVAGVVIREVTARNYNGDGISFQIAHDVRVEACHSHDHAGLGLHPGSGSQRPRIIGNRVERCDIGLFFCWGVRYALAEGNRLLENRVGLSIGHRDTHNLVVGNQIHASRECGIAFRPERGYAFAPHGNRFERNEVSDSGGAEAAAIDVEGQTEGVVLAANRIVENRRPEGRIGIRIGAQTREITLADNQFQGLARDLVDLRPPA